MIGGRIISFNDKCIHNAGEQKLDGAGAEFFHIDDMPAVFRLPLFFLTVVSSQIFLLEQGNPPFSAHS